MKPESEQRRLTWTDLRRRDIELYEQAKTVDEKHRFLHTLFQLDHDRKSLIVRDLYFYTLQYSKEKNYSAEKTSTFFSIVKAVHQACISTHLDNMDRTFTYFKELVLAHSVQRPPFSVGLFSPEEARKMTNYVLETYFRHFRMYKYAFTPCVMLDLSLEYEGGVEEEQEEVVDGAVNQDAQGGETGAPESAEVGEQAVQEAPQQDLTPAEKELKGIIAAAFKEHLKELKGSVDQQMKQFEETVTKQLSSLSGSEAESRAAKSSKGKRK